MRISVENQNVMLAMLTALVSNVHAKADFTDGIICCPLTLKQIPLPLLEAWNSIIGFLFFQCFQILGSN